MGFKAHWFQFSLLLLCITAAYSKPLPVESTSKGGTCTHNTGKGVVHKIHARDVGSDHTNPEYLLALAENTDQQDADSLTNFDDYEDESLDDDVSNSGDVIDLGGARADFLYEPSGDGHEDDDYDDNFEDDDVVDSDETSDYEDTFWGNDVVDDDEFRNTLLKEALDDDEDDIDSPDEIADSYGDAKVVSPDDDDDVETFGVVDVDDDYETNNESPDDNLNDNNDTHGDEVEGPMQVLEEPPSLKRIHKIYHKSKSSRPRNPLNKNSDSKLGRLLKKHHNKDATRKNSVKKYLDDDINDDDEFGDFKLSYKRKEKIPKHKGRRTISVSQNSDFSHVQKSEVIGSQDQRKGGDSVDRNVDDYDRQFLASRSDFFFENKHPFRDVSGPGLTSDNVFEEDKVEGEEEEDNEIKDVDNSSHKDDINFDESEVGTPRDDMLTDDDEQNDIASGIDAH